MTHMPRRLPLDGASLASLTQPRVKKMTATVPVTVSPLWKSILAVAKGCATSLSTKFKEIFKPAQVMKMFEVDFHEAKKDEQALSRDDRKFMKKAKEGIYRRNDGHYELPLPLKDERTLLPNNEELALIRIKKLKGRFKHDAAYWKDYQGFMSEVIEKGYAARVPSEELSLDNGCIWYIPQHGVSHPKKPGKIRVVFGASAEFKGVSKQTFVARTRSHK